MATVSVTSSIAAADHHHPRRHHHTWCRPLSSSRGVITTTITTITVSPTTTYSTSSSLPLYTNGVRIPVSQELTPDTRPDQLESTRLESTRPTPERRIRQVCTTHSAFHISPIHPSIHPRNPIPCLSSLLPFHPSRDKDGVPCVRLMQQERDRVECGAPTHIQTATEWEGGTARRKDEEARGAARPGPGPRQWRRAGVVFWGDRLTLPRRPDRELESFVRR